MNKPGAITSVVLIGVVAGAAGFAAVANARTPAVSAATPQAMVEPVARARAASAEIVLPACNAQGGIASGSEATSDAAVGHARDALFALQLTTSQITAIGIGGDCKIKVVLTPDMSTDQELAAQIREVLGDSLGSIGYGEQYRT